MTLPDDAIVVVHMHAGHYEVTRTFASLPAAMAAVEALGAISERAYTPPPAPPLPPAMAELMDRADEDAPTSGLKAGEAHVLNLPSTEDGS